MSLIHKALKKAEKRDDNTAPGMAGLAVPEEDLVENEGSFLSTKITTRTMVLMVLAFLALGYTVYKNFIKPKGIDSKVAVSSPYTKPIDSVAQNAVQAEADQAVKNMAGISKPTEGEKQKKLPPQAAALKDEGEDLFLSGNLDGAVAKFTEALTLSPNSPELLNSLGLVHKKKKDLVTAEKYYLQALQFDPQCAECLNNLGVLKVEKGDSISAVLHLKNAIKVSEEYADPYFNLAVLMESEGNNKSAVENYKKFLSYTSSGDEKFKKKIRERVESIALEIRE